MARDRYARPEKPKGRPKCWRISCDKPTVTPTACLCKRHQAEMETLGQDWDTYRANNCLPDKVKEIVKDRSVKKRARFVRPSDRNEDDE